MAKAEVDKHIAETVSLGTLDADLCSRLPHPVKVRLLSFLTLGLTGNFEVNVVAGKIKSYHVHEMGQCETGAAPRR